MGDYSGFAALGDIITGGARREAEANYPKYLAESANGYKALDVAAQERAKRLARDSIADRVLAFGASHGWSPEMSNLAAGFAAGGNMNFNTFGGGAQKFRDLDIDSAIDQAIVNGDPATARRLSAIKTDQVLPSLEAGGKVVFTPVTGDAQMTSLGDASIGAENALAEQRAAAGRLSNVKANAGGFAPRARSGGSSRGRSASEAKAIIGSLQKQMNRPLTPEEVEQVYSGGDFNFQDAPADIVPPTIADVVPSAGYVSFDDIPDSAKAKLAEGKRTTFGNGQVWTLVRGQPTRVK